MANFASEGLKIKHQSKNVEKFYNRWAEHVDLQGRVKDILRYYYKYGNVFIYMTPGIIDAGTYDRMKRAKARDFGEIDGFVKADSNDPAMPKRIDAVEKEGASTGGGMHPHGSTKYCCKQPWWNFSDWFTEVINKCL